MSDGLRLLISSTPLWQQGAMAHPLPVHVRTVYMVMGQAEGKWKNILSQTDDIYDARHAMDAANDSGLFSRIVISEGRSVNKAPANAWKTIECAICDNHVFTMMLRKKQEEQTKKKTKPQLPKGSYLVGHKQTQNFLLALACLLAALNQNVYALAAVSFLAVIDCLFLLDKRPLPEAQTKQLNTMRNWAFATLNGVLLLVLLLKTL